MMPRSGYLLAIAVLIGSVMLVLASWNTARERELHAAETRFEVRTGEIVDRLQRHLSDYELLARGGGSLFATVARPTPRQWADYADGMNLRSRFPAVTGLGFIGHVSSSRLDDLQIEWRDSGYGHLNVRPRGVRRHYSPILYLEPRTAANTAAIGFDLLSDPVCSSAMQAALDTGTAQLSGVTPAHPLRADLALYLPVYRGGDRPRTRAAREESIQGWVYVPFDVDQFVERQLVGRNEDLHFRIYDVERGQAELIYSREERAAEAPPAFQHQAEIDFYGRHWRIEFDSPPLALAAPGLQHLEDLLALELLASLLLFGTVWLLARTEDRAHAIALRLTEEYRRSEQRFRSSIRYAAIGKALLNSEGRIVEANPALGRIVGRTAESMIGETFESLFEENDESIRPHDEGRTDANGVHRVTRHLRREGDLPRQAQLTYAPLPGSIGQDVVGLVQVEDVTERVRAQARINALNRTLEARVQLRTRELSQANQELESFAYSVSHDLRAPLRAIDGFSRILLERYGDRLDDAGRAYLGRVRRAATRMGDLIDSILKISRVGRSELRHEPVDLSRLAAEVMEEIQADDRERRIDVRIAPGLRATGDATLLRDLLFNLLGNAWKFTREREHAVIEFGQMPGPAGESELFVRDNGAGFEQAYAEKLFRPFQRLHAQSEFSGHGIGLASVKRIIERHGGQIRAEGHPGDGATFYFTLPDVSDLGGDEADIGEEQRDDTQARAVTRVQGELEDVRPLG